MSESRLSLSEGGRRIAVVTGTRAEYGLLYWTMRELQMRGADVQLIVTGTHLSKDYGYTLTQIEADNFPVAATVDMFLTNDAPTHLAHSMSLALTGIANALDTIKPDILLLLGDRYETLAAASAAAMLGIPIAHIHGGEVTEGALDDSLRHAITKLSYWHFASTEAYARRIVQLGEEPSRVFTVGAPGIDAFVRTPLPSRATLENEFGIALKPPVLLITLHPETLSDTSAKTDVDSLIAALDAFPHATLLITGANADTGGRIINDAWQAYAQSRRNAFFRLSFGSALYLSAMRECDAVIGNSSSGVIEAPALGTPTVNIGDRQKGRFRAASVIDCPAEKDAIIAAIHRALAPEFRAKHSATPFGVPGEVAPKIAKTLCEIPLPPTIRKPFHDLT